MGLRTSTPDIVPNDETDVQANVMAAIVKLNVKSIFKAIFKTDVDANVATIRDASLSAQPYDL